MYFLRINIYYYYYYYKWVSLLRVGGLLIAVYDIGVTLKKIMLLSMGVTTMSILLSMISIWTDDAENLFIYVTYVLVFFYYGKYISLSICVYIK